ncbi:odorant receptor 131-2-like [Centropristis striata]|uniref:odorant receptor 131-2-like n=1 Tax=Centropristis striata TaxID=184440 RepID=UPI0027E1517E|nr:odorant receptor 131-2-like [Centropristis striata]
MNDTTEVISVMLVYKPVKALLSMLPCLLCLYVNCIMMFVLLRKPLLLESPRYILFGHLLLTDSLQLLIAMLLYIFALTMVTMMSYVCVIISICASITHKMSPMTITVMSLERYVAICFPLRHADVVTARKTSVVIAVMWTVVTLESFVDLFVFVSYDHMGVTLPRICRANPVLQLQVYYSVHRAIKIVFFVSVSMIVIYTYISIMLTVKSASSNVRNATKAHKTVLLHLLQLCMCLTSTLFMMINTSSKWNVSPAVAIDIQYALFVALIIFPKCLSPLIYGLRDHTFRRVFKYYFTFGFKIKP